MDREREREVSFVGSSVVHLGFVLECIFDEEILTLFEEPAGFPMKIYGLVLDSLTGSLFEFCFNLVLCCVY